jgi:hypothetical protein
MASAHAARVAAIANANLLNNNTNLMLSNLRGAKDEAIGYVDTAEPLQLNTLHDAYGQARDAYGTAKTEFQPYVDQGRQAGDLYNGSVGLGGATGHDAAVAAFQASPGYQYRVDQASTPWRARPPRSALPAPATPRPRSPTAPATWRTRSMAPGRTGSMASTALATPQPARRPASTAASATSTPTRAGRRGRVRQRRRSQGRHHDRHRRPERRRAVAHDG